MNTEFLVSMGLNVIIIVFGFVIAWVKLSEGVNNLKKNFEEFKSEIGEFKKDMGNKFDNISQKIEKVGEKIETVGNRISHLEGKSEGPFTRLAQANSPVTLTEVGLKILDESKAKEILEQNKKKVLDLILANPKPMNAYDAQEKTIMVIRNLENDQIFLPFKDYAFKKGMDVHSVLYVAAIYFRDIVLKELNFKIEDCDHKPTEIK